jgi:trehalose 6-phosphate synthase/phosphatase
MQLTTAYKLLHQKMDRRLIIVTNRLPVYFNETKKAMPVTAGLAASMQTYLKCLRDAQCNKFTETLWVGVTGCSGETWSAAAEDIDHDFYNYLPVHVDRNAYHDYYHLISNTVIWPLFHYFPSYAYYDFDAYEQYIKVNEIFAVTLIKQVRDDDVIWIHDYHLLPLAAMLRKKLPGVSIGFFLHIPFPSYEIIRLMPKIWQQELIRGMLGADVIGFHTTDYAVHFLETATSVLGIAHEQKALVYEGRSIKVDAFPIGIDFNKFHDAFDKEEVVKLRTSLKDSFESRKIMFSIGKLNYTRGIFNRIKAFEYFLSSSPEFKNKVVFLLVIVPSADDFGKYEEQKKMIDEAISNINSTIGNISWQPIAYQYRSLSFDMSMALYTSADLALITPLRDGMNLVSKEYVAARKDKQGVLVLSELAGAAKELTGALLVNPNDLRETAAKIKQGLVMPASEQALRMEAMQKRLSEYDICTWAENFIHCVEKDCVTGIEPARCDVREVTPTASS